MSEVKEIVRRAAFEELQKVIRDAFLEGDDQAAMRILDSPEYRTLKNATDVGKRTMVAITSYEMIASGSSAMLFVRPQICPYQVDRVIVSPSCASNFVILDLRVGNRSQLPASGDLAADMFAVAPPLEWLDERDENGDPFISIRISAQGELAIGIPIDFEKCLTSQDLVMVVLNIGVIPSHFRGAFLGRVLHE